MRFNESVFYCVKKPTPEGIEEYDEPNEIVLRPGYFSVQPANGYTALQTFGKEITSYQTAICQPYELWKDKFHEGDVFYIDDVKPTDKEECNGELANYVIDKVFKQNLALRLTLKRR